MKFMKFIVAFLFTILAVVSSQSNTYAKISQNDLTPYYDVIENNQFFKKTTKNAKFDSKFIGSSIKVVKDEENRHFNNDISIVQGKLKGKDITVAAIFNNETKELYSYTVISFDKNKTGHDIKEYNAKTGELTLFNHIDQKGNVDTQFDQSNSDSNVRAAAIKPGSYWWKVICGLAVGGQCSLGCLSLIAVPGGYPTCTLICSAMAGGAAC